MQEIRPLLNITPIAASKLKEVLEREGLQNSILKIEVYDGGCACSGGYRYAMSLVDSLPDDFIVEEIDGLKFAVSKEDEKIIRGSRLDFYESLQRTGFRIENPNVKTTECGCGHH